MSALKSLAILTIILIICIITFALIWALATISIYIGIPFVFLVAIFLIVFFIKVAGRA